MSPYCRFPSRTRAISPAERIVLAGRVLAIARSAPQEFSSRLHPATQRLVATTGGPSRSAEARGLPDINEFIALTDHVHLLHEIQGRALGLAKVRSPVSRVLQPVISLLCPYSLPVIALLWSCSAGAAIFAQHLVIVTDFPRNRSGDRRFRPVSPRYQGESGFAGSPARRRRQPGPNGLTDTRRPANNLRRVPYAFPTRRRRTHRALFRAARRSRRSRASGRRRAARASAGRGPRADHRRAGRRRAFLRRRSARGDRAQGASGESLRPRRQGRPSARLSPGAGAAGRLARGLAEGLRRRPRRGRQRLWLPARRRRHGRDARAL